MRPARELAPVLARLKAAGIRVSLFLDPDPAQVEAAARVGADRIELYTEGWARAFGTPAAGSACWRATPPPPARAQAVGLGVNAGHDLTLANLGPFLAAVPDVLEVSIGHAFVCEAFDHTLEGTVARYLEIVGVAPLTGSAHQGGVVGQDEALGAAVVVGVEELEAGVVLREQAGDQGLQPLVVWPGAGRGRRGPARARRGRRRSWRATWAKLMKGSLPGRSSSTETTRPRRIGAPTTARMPPAERSSIRQGPIGRRSVNRMAVAGRSARGWRRRVRRVGSTTGVDTVSFYINRPYIIFKGDSLPFPPERSRNPPRTFRIGSRIARLALSRAPPRSGTLPGPELQQGLAPARAGRCCRLRVGCSTPRTYPRRRSG